MRPSVLTVILGAVSGFVGSAVHDAVYPRSAIIRAQAYELVRSDGSVVGYWGKDKSGSTVLTISAEGGHRAIEIRVETDATVVNLNGNNSERRASLQVSQDQPGLVMSDDHTEGRLILGVVAGEARKSWNASWGLSIRDGGTSRPRASLVVSPSKNGKVSEGTLYLSGKEKRRLFTSASP